MAAMLQQRYGPQALRRANELTQRLPPHIPTGFTNLDAVTGCGGIPVGMVTLLSGYATSGKMTVAYKTITQVHSASQRAVAAILDLNRSTDPDYLERAGVDLKRLLLMRPGSRAEAVSVILDLARQRNVRLLVVDSLPDLLAQRDGVRQIRTLMGPLVAALRETNAAVVFIDEPKPAWIRWLNLDQAAAVRRWAALHLELRHEQWLMRDRELVGYGAQACVLKTRWGKGGKATVQIEFNGTIRARETW